MAEQVTVGELLVRIRADVGQLDAGLRKVEQGITSTATKGSRNLGRLENAFRTLAVAGVGITGPLGFVARALLAFGGGGLLITGALAGLGAIVMHFQRIKKAAQEAAAAQADFTKRLIAVGAPGIGEQRVAAEARLANLQQRMQGILAGPGLTWRGVRTGLLTPSQAAEVKKLQTEIKGLQQELMLLNRQAQTSNEAFRALSETFARVREAITGAATGPTMADIPGQPRGIHPAMQRILGGQARLMEGLSGRIGQIAGRDIGSILASDENVQRILRAFEQQRNAFVAIGQSIGFALQDGIYSILGGGNFFKGLFRSLLGIGIGALTSGIGGAITGVLTGGLTAGKSAGPSLSLGMARDANWQRFFRESGLVAASQGFRG